MPDQIVRHDENAPAGADEPIRLGLRQRHGVRIVSEAEEGAGIDALPGGVYGFTFAPHSESPLFRGRAFQCYEVHKVTGEDVQILGYMSPDEAARVDSIEEVTLFPEPYGTATELIALAKSRIMKTKGPTRDEGNGMKVLLLPSAV